MKLREDLELGLAGSQHSVSRRPYWESRWFFLWNVSLNSAVLFVGLPRWGRPQVCYWSHTSFSLLSEPFFIQLSALFKTLPNCSLVLICHFYIKSRLSDLFSKALLCFSYSFLTLLLKCTFALAHLCSVGILTSQVHLRGHLTHSFRLSKSTVCFKAQLKFHLFQETFSNYFSTH